MSKEKASKLDFKKIMPLVTRVALVLIVAFLICYVALIFGSSREYFDGFTERNELISFEEDIAKAEAEAEKHFDNIRNIAKGLMYADSEKTVLDKMEEAKIRYSADVGNLRFYSQTEAYTVDGMPIEDELSANVLIDTLVASEKEGCTPIYFDQMVEMDCVAFFAPVRGSTYVDGVLSIVPARSIINLEGVLRDNAAAVVLTDGNGRVYASVCADSLEGAIGPELYDFVDKLTQNDIDQGILVTRAFDKKEKTACTVKTTDGGYTFSIAPLETFDSNMRLVTISKSEGIIAPELLYIRHMLNICVLAVLALAIGGIYGFIYYKKSKSAIDAASYLDPVVGCPNGEQFKNTAGNLLQNPNHSYCLAVAEIRQFDYLSEKLEGKEITEMLQYIAKIIETFCDIRETYGYLGGGRFAMLLSYEGESSVRGRVRLIQAVSSKHQILGARKSKRNFNIGVTIAPSSKKYTVQDFINYASIACERAKNDITVPYMFYTEEINTEREHTGNIEAEMETALANDEFRLFLQPKYSISGDRLDSAEALVRWFDTKTGDFRFPAEFIGLFEQNGFIVKLDHFMYLEVLKFLNTTVERGDKVVPISVNVSLLTVLNEDFLSFYVDAKRQYGVGDGFIILEITESFAMEDYNKIREIIEELHKNGIKCSLDDFGSGYSSLGVIKNIPFDEVKFDRLFLRDGIDKQNDNKVLETMFSLAHSLGMRVVQEGVETKEMFDASVEGGCDVIQGYYYAKAIPVEEFKLFMKSNTSIKYKSKVK